MNQPIWVAKAVEFGEDYTLILTYADGKRKFDFKPLLDLKIYSKLKNPAVFRSGCIGGGTVIWDDETDIAPETLYEESVPLS